MHPVFLCNFPVEIPVIESAILHTVFKLLFPCFLQDVSEGIAKINYPHFLPLCRADFVLMGSTVVTDAPVDCQALFLKVDVLPSQPCNFPKPESCEIGYLYGQDCVLTPLAKLCNQFWYCSNDSGLTLPLSVSVSSANKSISSFLCLMTTYCIGLNVMYCFGNTAKRNDCCNTAENDVT